jgi:hypothetical protein
MTKHANKSLFTQTNTPYFFALPLNTIKDFARLSSAKTPASQPKTFAIRYRVRRD